MRGAKLTAIITVGVVVSWMARSHRYHPTVRRGPRVIAHIEGPRYPSPGDAIDVRFELRSEYAIGLETISIEGGVRRVTVRGDGVAWHDVIADHPPLAVDRTVQVEMPADSGGKPVQLRARVEYTAAKPHRGTFDLVHGKETVDLAVLVYEPATAMWIRIGRAALAALALALACVLASSLVPRVRRWLADERLGTWVLGLIAAAVAGVAAYVYAGYAWFAPTVTAAAEARSSALGVVAFAGWLAAPAALVLARQWRTGRPQPRMLKLRAHELARANPYRDELWEPRVVEPRPLAAVIEAIRAAGLEPRARRDGFELRRGVHRLRGQVADVARVDPGTLQLTTDSYDLHIELALALVPLFGALAAQVGPAWLIVDGARDRDSLHRSLDEQFRKLAEAEQPRA